MVVLGWEAMPWMESNALYDSEPAVLPGNCLCFFFDVIHGACVLDSSLELVVLLTSVFLAECAL
jgi:hypothetical protein